MALKDLIKAMVGILLVASAIAPLFVGSWGLELRQHIGFIFASSFCGFLCLSSSKLTAGLIKSGTYGFFAPNEPQTKFIGLLIICIVVLALTHLFIKYEFYMHNL